MVWVVSVNLHDKVYLRYSDWSSDLSIEREVIYFENPRSLYMSACNRLGQQWRKRVSLH